MPSSVASSRWAQVAETSQKPVAAIGERENTLAKKIDGLYKAGEFESRVVFAPTRDAKGPQEMEKQSS
jgi:hypothetical protein